MTLFPIDQPTGTSVSNLARLGTSTWTYEGWQEQVYKREYAKTTLARECLGEYCQYLYQGAPLFRTVGNDSPVDSESTQTVSDADPRRL